MKDDRWSLFSQDSKHFRRPTQQISFYYFIRAYMLPRWTMIGSSIVIRISPLDCKGLYLGASDENATTPLALSDVQGGGFTFDLVLASHNESAKPITGLTWQAMRQIQPLARLEGTCLFQSTTSPAYSPVRLDARALIDLTEPSDQYSEAMLVLMEFRPPVRRFRSLVGAICE